MPLSYSTVLASRSALGPLLIAGLILAGCEQEPPPPPQAVRPVKILSVGDTEGTRVRDYPGTIRAAQTAEMAFEVPGRITEFLVKEGDQIAQGAVLAKLDPRDYVAERNKQQANLRKAQADLTRSQNIFKEDPGAISKEKIDADKRALGVAEANVAQADKAVEDTALVAPFSGLMARKLVEDFQNVKAKQPVLILQDLSHLEIEISVPERDMTRRQKLPSPDALTERIKPRVVISSVPDREFPARVKEMATTADPTTRTFQVKLTFERPDDVNVLPGMTARVIVEPAGGAVLLLPSHATRADADGKPYVWVVDPATMTVSRRPVELGNLTGGSVEIVSGLEKGEQVAISGVKQLVQGMEVRRYESQRGATKS
jgi:RND family efflux transporter MFP subunit